MVRNLDTARDAAVRDRLVALLRTYDTGAGTVSRRTRLTARQRAILQRLSLLEPPRSYDFSPLDD